MCLVSFEAVIGVVKKVGFYANWLKIYWNENLEVFSFIQAFCPDLGRLIQISLFQISGQFFQCFRFTRTNECIELQNQVFFNFTDWFYIMTISVYNKDT